MTEPAAKRLVMLSCGGQVNGWPAKGSAKAHNLMVWEAK